MICVTGASGTLSSEVIRQLESSKTPFRGAYFSNKRAEAACARGIEAPRKGGFAVVDVGNNGDISKLGGHTNSRSQARFGQSRELYCIRLVISDERK